MPSSSPTWMWALTSAGITVLPARSTRVPPGGSGTAPVRPTTAIRPASTTNAAPSIGAVPSPTINRAPSNSVGDNDELDVAEGGGDAHAAAAAITSISGSSRGYFGVTVGSNRNRTRGNRAVASGIYTRTTGSSMP